VVCRGDFLLPAPLVDVDTVDRRYRQLSRICEPEQVLIITGSQSGLDLIARILLDWGDKAWMEDPGYPSARAVLQGAGVLPHSVPVDEDGLDVAAGCTSCPAARLAYVTPEG
jgi:GntR family transcriptional regulator/MocR family aminotransferase